MEDVEIGDWVTADVSGKLYVGFVTKLGTYVTFVQVTHPPEYAGETFRPTHANVRPFNPDFVAAEDLTALIDIALDVGDREWFAELTERREAA
ncbi:IDEAL domain-containing protein [Paenibacillus sp. 7124]|uniref:IDEAL domain-containing protein n=1 Tax=Paenibacillus apii TaxID=1850370 RepID=A0A6M1PDF6_9BACL|nr:IDEAL domain-containing protein [Paenibacillus apii]NGM81257.1 IDEAL domain-containing protein [Paenibacillus apii]